MQRRTEGAVPVDEVRAYSSLAGYALAVVLVTGVLRATQEVGGLSKLFDLFRGSYGTTLDVKVSLVLVLIGLGAFNRYRSIPRMESRDRVLRRVMAIELVGAVGVFSLTGMLTGLAPRPPVNPPAPPPARVTLTGSDFATTMKVTLVDQRRAPPGRTRSTSTSPTSTRARRSTPRTSHCGSSPWGSRAWARARWP